MVSPPHTHFLSFAHRRRLTLQKHMEMLTPKPFFMERMIAIYNTITESNPQIEARGVELEIQIHSLASLGLASEKFTTYRITPKVSPAERLLRI